MQTSELLLLFRRGLEGCFLHSQNVCVPKLIFAHCQNKDFTLPCTDVLLLLQSILFKTSNAWTLVFMLGEAVKKDTSILFFHGGLRRESPCFIILTTGRYQLAFDCATDKVLEQPTSVLSCILFPFLSALSAHSKTCFVQHSFECN